MLDTVDNREVLDAQGVAEALGVSESTVRRLWRSGELASFTVASLRRSRRSDLRAYIRRRIREEGADRI